MRRKARAYYVSRKQAKELLAQPGCTKDKELSQLLIQTVISWPIW